MKSWMIFAFLLMCFTGEVGALDAPKESLPDGRPELLRSLDGRWTMVGDVRGKPVRYVLNVSPILQGKYSELHMKDIGTPARYEAKVIIGTANDSATLIVHWLDSFGAAYSIPHGEGKMTETALEFSFSYSGGKFRDVLRRDAVTNTWTLKIESEQKDGSWKHFAHYTIVQE